MTRPAPEIVWDPDPDDAHTVWAVGRGLGWHYTLYWGDGTQRDMTWQSQAVPKTYTVPGTYSVVAVSSLHSTWTASAEVAVREFTSPPTPGSSLDGRAVTLTMPDVADPVRWRVAWGDGVTSEHTGRTAEHDYPWGFGAPQITVTDLPSRRSVRFTGPEIGPEPPPPPAGYQGFCFEFLDNDGNRRRFALHGGGLPAGEEVTFYASASQLWFRTLTADAAGEVHDTVDVDIPYGDTDMWWSYAVSTTTRGLVFVPLRGPAFERGDPQVTYQLSAGDTRTIEFTAHPPLAGEYHVDYGDGHDETVHVEKVPLLTSHRYGGSGTQFEVTVTFPDGRVATRTVTGSNPCPPCFNPHYPGSCTVGWYITGGYCGACGQNGGEHFSPVEIRDHYHAAARVHLPDNPGGSGWHNVYGFGGFTAGQYTFDYRTALQPPWSHPVTIGKSGTRRHRRTIELYPIDDETQHLTAWFGLDEAWDGGYRGTFHVHNHTSTEVRGWHVEFSLADPAVLRDAWPDAELVELGQGRWRITSTRTMAAGTDAAVTARVEPPGKTRQFPDDIQASPR